MKYQGNELYHWGILGQKWGERRYQNPDGTYTEAGKARRRKDTSKYEAKKKAIDETKNFTNTLKNVVSKVQTKNSNNLDNLDVSSMTDQDLQNYIRRYNLEKQYKDIINQNTVNSGKQTALAILDTTGDILSVAGSAAALYLSLRAIKGVGL